MAETGTSGSGVGGVVGVEAGEVWYLAATFFSIMRRRIMKSRATIATARPNTPVDPVLAYNSPPIIGENKAATDTKLKT